MSIALTQQQLEALSLPPELVVSAAAGSGKTEVLVRRVLDAALTQGIPLDRMLIVTFTRSAAAELRERLRRGLNTRLVEQQQLGSPLEPIRLQLAALERAQISTIHSFCLDIVQRYGYLHGLSAARILPDDEARLLRHEVCGEMVLTQLSDPLPELRAAALSWGGPDGLGYDDLSQSRNSRGLRDLVLRLHDFRRSLPDPQAWFAQMVDVPPLDPEHCDPEHPLVIAALRPLHDWCRDFATASSGLARQLQTAGTGVNAARLLTRRCDALGLLQLCHDWNGLLAAFAALDESLPLPYPPQSLLATYTRNVDDDELKTQISDVAKSGQAAAKLLRPFYTKPWRDVALRENETRGRLLAVWKLAEEFDQLYATRKQELGAVDYADLEGGALRLLLDEGAGVAVEVAAELDFVLVDEYQDTSPIQDAIIALITPGEPKSRFIVGDLKQSIYAFRLAEPSLFSRHHARLNTDAVGGSALKLTGNFRSRAKLVAAINHIFDGLLCEELGGEDYTQNRLTASVDYRQLCGDGFTDDLPARLHLVEVQKGRLRSSGSEDDAEEVVDIDDDSESPAASDPQYARVAAILREIHSGGQPIYDKQLGQTRPAKWCDMAVLLRSSRGRVEALRRELERAGIPSYAPGRSGFYERPEIGDALSLLAVVDNPRQDIPLAAVLTGPAVGLSPADLARIVIGSSAPIAADIAQEYGAGDLWRRVERYLEHGADEVLLAKLTTFTSRLERWRDTARSEPLDKLLQILLHDSGLTAAAAALKNGRQRLANLAALAERARQFGQARQGLSAFLEYISASRRAAGDSGEAALLTEQQDVVRVLTVHQAKGLEFPIVVVPDLHREFNLRDIADDVQWHFRAGLGGRHYDLAEFKRYDTLARRVVAAERKRAAVSEELRILYVALTRARERLELVAAVEPAGLERLTRQRGADAQSWLQWVAPQLKDAVANIEGGRLQSCGDDGCWEVLLHSGADVQIGATQQQTMTSAAELDLVLRRLHAEYPQAGSSRLPAKVAVTHLSKSELEPDAEFAVPLGEAREQFSDVQPAFLSQYTPTGADVGTAVHKLLAAIEPREFAQFADARELDNLREMLIRSGKLSRRDSELIHIPQVAQCCAELTAAMPRILHSEYQHFVELPVSLLVPATEVAAVEGIDPASVGGELVHVQGAVDLLLDDGRTVLVLDYKTGYTADPETLKAIHAQQLGWYCRAVSMLLPDRRVLWALYGLGGAGLVGPFEYVAPPLR